MGQSINQIEKFCLFFFLRSGKKKIQGCIFFFPEKVHEPFIQDLVGFSLFFYESVVCFFFSKFLCVFCVFFFSCKSSHSIHSIDLEAVFFFLSLEKKNTAFLIIQSIFPQNVEEMNFNRKKKKYDTFGCTQDVPSKLVRKMVKFQGKKYTLC